MDAFYAAIEQRDDPALRGKPVLVGGRSPRSVVATASYEARRFGARSAMPMGEALRRCPDAIVVPPRMAHYGEVSRAVMGILRRYTPLVEPLSLDEAFLDVTASRALFGEAAAIAGEIRAAIRAEVDLTASAGVASSKFVAKVASDLKKPDGLTVVAPGTERAFLAPLPVERMWGVGPKAAETLKRAGLRTLGDLARATPRRLASLLGESWGPVVGELARGVDERPVVPDRDAVSIGAEETFDADLSDVAAIEQALLGQAARVAERLVRGGLRARVVVLKVKLPDHTLLTRRTTLPEPVADTSSIHRAVCKLLQRLGTAGLRVRLTGVSVSDLVEEAAMQRSLFPDEAVERRSRLEKTLLDVRSRFGKEAVLPAGLVDAGRARRLPGRDDPS